MRLLATFAVTSALLLSANAALADTRVYDNKDEDHPRALDLYGWIQPRFTLPQRDENRPVPFTPNPAFTLQRFRLGAIAQLDWWATARFELEFAGQQQTPLMDAYVVASPLPEFAFSVGQMRVPISRQNLLPSKAFQLPDTAYFIDQKFIHDRDMGAMVSGKLFGDRVRYFFGIFDGNEPGRGNAINNDKYFMYAGRLEVSPLGPTPRFEGDLRPLDERHDFVFNVSGSWMHNRLEDKFYYEKWFGADFAAYFEGASIYAEYLYKKQTATADAANNPPDQTAEGWNVQGGYFLPIPWVQEHLEIAGRIERFDPNKQVKHPADDPGARDLSASNPLWGYQGFIGGLNIFPLKTHDWKLQGSYEVRNEVKKCLEGQIEPNCSGYIKNNLLVIQATGAF